MQPAEQTRQPMRAVVTASLSGALLEWYDFNLYGISAALVFNKLFFPQVDPVIGTLASLATFGVGFVSRPIGAVVFGHWGDRLGRKRMLVVTLLVIGVATVAIGCLPTYDAIGVWAPVLLVVARLVQDFGLGGEFGGAALLTVEHAPRERRGLWGSIPQTGGAIGYLLALAVVGLFGLLPDEHFLTWGWRLPFLFSVVLLAVGLVVRLRIQETPAFRSVEEHDDRERVPLVSAVRRYPRTLLLAFGARIGEGGSSQIYQPFALGYVTTTLGFGQGVAFAGVAAYNILGLLLIPVAGAVSDRIGRKPLYLVGGAFVALSAFPYFALLGSGSRAAAITALALSTLGGAVCMSSLQATWFTELFGTNVRYSGMSLVFQASAMVNGFIPAIALSLLAASGNATTPVALLVVGIGVLSFVCTLFLPETRHRDTAETEHALATGRNP